MVVHLKQLTHHHIIIDDLDVLLNHTGKDFFCVFRDANVICVCGFGDDGGEGCVRE